MDKNVILAIVLSLGIWVGWQKLYMEPYQQQYSEWQKSQQKIAKDKEVAKKATANEKNAKDSFAKISKDETKEVPLRAERIETDKYIASFSNGPDFLQGFVLKEYQVSDLDRNKDSKTSAQNIDLKTITGYSKQLRIRFRDESLQSLNEKNWNRLYKKGNKIGAEFYNNKIKAIREIEPSDKDYSLNLSYQISFRKEVPAYIYLDLFGNPKRDTDDEGSIFGEQPDMVQFSYRNLQGRESFIAAHIDEKQESNSKLSWMGIDTRYFLLGILPSESLKPISSIQIMPRARKDNAARGSLVIATEGKRNINFAMKLYFGPKKIELLEDVSPLLTDAIDFGWTTPLAIPLLKSLKWLYQVFGNYGIAIILLTVAVKILLFPLTYKSMKSMAKMAKLQPQLTKLREKYKDDKERLNREMMSFMKTQGYNPVGGCLPILLQMPIFFALYRVLFNSMELYQAPFYFWIQDLSVQDPWFVTPILLTLLMYLQQKLTPATTMDPAQQKVMQMMPLMFGVFMIMLPAGLNLYMLVNSFISIVQQKYLNNKFGVNPPSPNKDKVPAKSALASS